MRGVADIVSNYVAVAGLQRSTLAARQAYLSATDYHNGSHYAALTDLTSTAALTHIHRLMQQDPTGSLILTERPRITDETLESLSGHPEHSFGRHYYSFMTKNNFRPSQRPLVKYVDDLELAYVCQRYKQIHDFLHILLLDGVDVHNQLVVKWFEMVQLGLPSATLAVLASPFLSAQMTLAQTADICRKANRCKFIMNIHFQQQFSTPLQQLRKKIGLL